MTELDNVENLVGHTINLLKISQQMEKIKLAKINDQFTV